MIFRAIKQYTLLFLLIIWQPNNLAAQENQPVAPFMEFLSNLQAQPKQGEGVVVIHQDRRLVNQAIKLNESNSLKKGIPGYRIRIFSASGKDAKSKMTAEYTRFVRSFEDISTYIEYDAPYWKIYVGDFRTRSDAEKIKQVIIKYFPTSFIRSARVKMPESYN